MKTRIALAVATLVAASVAGCSREAAPPDAGPTTSGLHAYAACLRANGHPEFPDPIPDDRGRWRMPEDAPQPDPVPATCAPIARGYKEQVAGDEERERAAEMPQRRAFAACMREHGVPGFPDPDSTGNFEWPEGQQPAESLLRPAEEACRHLLPSLGEKN
jgi:hypothetical protein